MSMRQHYRMEPRRFDQCPAIFRFCILPPLEETAIHEHTRVVRFDRVRRPCDLSPCCAHHTNSHACRMAAKCVPASGKVAVRRSSFGMAFQTQRDYI